MKAILFILLVCGFYYGMNQYALSEGPIDRWIKSTHYPIQESADKFCQAIGPLTEVNYRVTEDGARGKIAAEKSEDLCPYWQQQVFPDANFKNAHLSISNLQIERIQEFPFNSAKVSFDVKTNMYLSRSVPDPSNYLKKITKNEHYAINRHEEIVFKRDLLGNYHFISFAGNEDLKYPPKYAY